MCTYSRACLKSSVHLGAMRIDFLMLVISVRGTPSPLRDKSNALVITQLAN